MIPFDQAHAFANVGMLHSDGPDQLGSIIGAGKINLGFPVAEDMHMCRFMIIREDHKPKTFGAQNRNQSK